MRTVLHVTDVPTNRPARMRASDAEYNATVWQSTGTTFSFRTDSYTQPELLLLTGEQDSIWQRLEDALWLYGRTNPLGIDRSLGFVQEMDVR